MQFRVQVLFRAGMLPINTVAEPGVHGAGVTGTQGCGVSTPRAAEVAAATAGLLTVVHMTKGITLVMGILSMILAAGILLLLTRLFGNTTNEEGAVPKEHVREAPMQTCCGINKVPQLFSYQLFSYQLSAGG
jgi:hypothetical protein